MGHGGDSRSVMPVVDLDLIISQSSSDKPVASAAAQLATIHLDSGASCLALRLGEGSEPQTVEQLVRELLRLNVPVVLMAPFDLAHLPDIRFTNVLGVIVEGALIVPSGHRRDYFRALALRKIVAKCANERERRPNFFFGMLDLWDARPSAAVIKRGDKLARHFGAIFSHRPSHAIFTHEPSPPVPSATIGGFEQLRRGEITDLHKAWCLDDVPVVVNEKATDVLPLPTAELAKVLPEVDRLLEPFELTPTLAAVASEKPQRVIPPSYIDLAPRRTNIWTVSSDMGELSPQGCYPLTSSPSKDDYAAVLDEQVHLKTLRLLQPIKGNEVHRIVQQFKLFAQKSANRSHLLDALIDGLSQHRITISKGLDSGFGTPTGDGYFWGVSNTRKGSSSGIVDIFISLRTPSDTATILHTWLAHNGVERSERYMAELELERICDENPKLRIPNSISTSLERATNAELLFFLEQLCVTQFSHEFRKPMIELCRHLLIDEAASGQWRRLHSLNTLSGTTDVKELLEIRLETFARAGARRLPLIENLLKLHDQVSSLVTDALYYGDKRALAILSDALAEAYSPESSESSPSSDPAVSTRPLSSVDVNADLFGLLFFLALREAAFEDVYLESTDRCPYFLSQPDQAAVFSELWVLGSQCEIYFGILPRDLGEIVYNMYREYLTKNPPPDEPPRGSDDNIITMYWAVSAGGDQDGKLPAGSYAAPVTTDSKVRHLKKRVQDFGALSIFCFPAILDVVLLSFLGRGLFATAFMDPAHITASGYAILISLLLAAGITGWAGSVGHYYMPHVSFFPLSPIALEPCLRICLQYAYDNMVYFHVQRLSGGFMLTFVVAAIGLAVFAATYDIYIGLIFAAYLIIVTTYLMLLGKEVPVKFSEHARLTCIQVSWRRCTSVAAP